MINFFVEDIEFPSFIEEQKLKKWIKTIIEQQDKKIGEISYVFCSDEYILKINQEFLNHHYYTDIISFDYSKKDRISGDIYISLDTVKANAKDYKQTYEKELMRVIIHGILHLCGQKDESPEEFLQMKEKEEAALALLA